MTVSNTLSIHIGVHSKAIGRRKEAIT